MSYNGRIPVPGFVSSVRKTSHTDRKAVEQRKLREKEDLDRQKKQAEEVAVLLSKKWAEEDRRKKERRQERRSPSYRGGRGGDAGGDDDLDGVAIGTGRRSSSRSRSPPRRRASPPRRLASPPPPLPRRSSSRSRSRPAPGRGGGGGATASSQPQERRRRRSPARRPPSPAEDGSDGRRRRRPEDGRRPPPPTDARAELTELAERQGDRRDQGPARGRRLGEDRGGARMYDPFDAPAAPAEDAGSGWRTGESTGSANLMEIRPPDKKKRAAVAQKAPTSKLQGVFGMEDSDDEREKSKKVLVRTKDERSASTKTFLPVATAGSAAAPAATVFEVQMKLQAWKASLKGKAASMPDWLQKEVTAVMGVQGHRK